MQFPDPAIGLQAEMTISQLPLSYCTNVHPGRSVAEVNRGLDEVTCPVQQAWEQPLAAGLWLAQPVVRELTADADNVKRFVDGLHERGLTCHTLNAFPYGDFHSERVKENVYLPDWSQPERLDYTIDCAEILTELLPADGEGSISTVPLGFKGFQHPDNFGEECLDQFLEFARRMDLLQDRTGKLIRLAIEPEPYCLLETTAEAVAFFQRLWARADTAMIGDAVRRHIGLCYDVCHQAVEFEDITRSIQSIDAAGIRINKLHISCAIQLDDPANNEAGRRALATYVEPRYLHQTMALTPSGRVLHHIDLSRGLALEPTPDFLEARQWRIHFHVPVDAETLGPLRTTRDELRQAIAVVAQLDYAPHLEVETYTWEVLPDDAQGPAASNRLIDGLVRELRGTRDLLAAVS